MLRFGPSVEEVSPADTADLLKSATPPLLIDVREPDEWNAGHVAGATHIPLGVLSARAHELPQDREIIVMCRSGGRSARATEALVKAGYKARNLHGGILAWEQAKLPVTQ